MPKFNFTREFYVPKDYAEIKREDGAGAVVYASACGLIAMGFSGKRQKRGLLVFSAISDGTQS